MARPCPLCLTPLQLVPGVGRAVLLNVLTLSFLITEEPNYANKNKCSDKDPPPSLESLPVLRGNLLGHGGIPGDPAPEAQETALRVTAGLASPQKCFCGWTVNVQSWVRVKASPTVATMCSGAETPDPTGNW